MEDESYRNLVVTKLNRTYDRKIGPDDHIDDVVSIITKNNLKFLKNIFLLESFFFFLVRI